MIEIYSWIDLIIPEKNPQEKAVILAGNAISHLQEKGYELKNEILAGILMFLIVFLIVLLFYKKTGLTPILN